MAVMQRCCCCGVRHRVRAGSIASAIYSLVIAILGLANFGHGLLGIGNLKEGLYAIQQAYPEKFGDIDVDSYVSAMYAEYLFACIAQGLILIASILCIVGINQDNKGLLVPFMAAKSLGFVWYLFAIACSGYFMAQVGMEVAGATVIILMILLIPFFISDIVCLLCVLSQYQEYRDGRGRLGFAYSQVQDPPPAYAYPMVTKGNVI